MPENAAEASASGPYNVLRIASWIALVAILAAIAFASTQAILNWNVISV